MSSKRPESSGDVGLTEAQREARKARRQKKACGKGKRGIVVQKQTRLERYRIDQFYGAGW